MGKENHPALRWRKEIAKAAYAAGKREAAEHILSLWRQPWGVTEKPFIKLLEAYVEELK